MERFLENSCDKPPAVSIILVDWSCRESFHVLHYLDQQNVPRDRYEVIWIEFYERRAEGIQKRLNEDREKGRRPSLDQWLALGFSRDLCHHKHLMYNVGITAANGRVVTFCDSDAMLKPTFVQSIIDSFDAGKHSNVNDPGIVLHCDEIRNVDKKFYPFSSPDFEEVKGEGCINWNGETTTGLMNQEDPLHHRNYGACMSALKEDLIAIGGADEHLDYVGHICGPYEMTFRLVNAGKKEVWHPGEFLYHTWHPGTDGEYDHLGPHDGFHMSSTALSARATERILPLQENPALNTLRTQNREEDSKTLLKLAMNVQTHRWDIKSLKRLDHKRTVSSSILVNVIGQFLNRAAFSLKKHKTLKGLLRAVFYTSFFYVRDLVRQNTQIQVNCRLFLENLVSENAREFAIAGIGEVAEHLYSMAQKTGLNIKGIYDREADITFHEYRVAPMEDLKGYEGKVVLGTHDALEHRVNLLKDLGIPSDRIIVLM